MDNNDEFGFGKNSDLNELFKLLRQAMEEQSEEDSNKDSLDSYFNQFNNMSNTLFPLSSFDNTEPDKVEKFSEGNLNYEIKYWFLPEGEFRSVEVTGEASLTSDSGLEESINKIMSSNIGANKFSVDVNRRENQKSLEQMLDDAVKKEDYMLAAKIRDEINSRKEKMNGKIIEINLALEQGDIDKSERLLSELRRIVK